MTTPVPDHNLGVALTLANAGFKILPCGADKAPLGALAPQGYKSATSDVPTIREWWDSRPDALPGIVPGSAGGVVFDLDVDRRTGQPVGEEQWRVIKSDHRIDDSAAVEIRTPSGGRHVYMARPPGVKNIGNTTLAPNIDVRCDAGYVIALGARLGDGRMYGESDSAERLALAVMGSLPVAPATLFPVRRQRDVATDPVELDHPATIDRAVAFLHEEAVLAIEGQHGDETTYKTAAQLREIGVSESTACGLMWEHWNDRCTPPWTVDELATKVGNAYAYATGVQGGKAPEHLFRNVKPPPSVSVTSVSMSSVDGHRRKGWHGDDWRDTTQWLFNELLPASGVTAIVGPSGSGKSFLTLELAKCVATGQQFFGIEPEAVGGTIVVACEAVGTMNSRLAALAIDAETERLNGRDGKPASCRWPVAWVEAGGLSSESVLATLEAEIEAIANDMQTRFGVRLRMIVLDTLRASGLVEDENKNGDMARAVSKLSTLAGRLGVLVVIIHHPRKDSAVEAGGGAFRAALDALIMIDRKARQPTRRVSLDKSRDGEERESAVSSCAR